MSSNIRVTKRCKYCNQEYTAKTIHTRYCSHACNRKGYKATKRNEKVASVNSAKV